MKYLVNTLANSIREPAEMDLNYSKPSGILKIVDDNKYFIVPFIVLFTLTMTLLWFIGNNRLFLDANKIHFEFADLIFPYLTNFGDGIIAIIFVTILLWVSFREALTFLILTIVLAILVNLLKNDFFPDYDRPVWYFGASALHLIPGYDPPLLHTFPSGHTVTAFSVCLYLSFLINQKMIKFVLFFLAVIIGYSRIYLCAHFPFDVAIGALISVVITTLIYHQSLNIKNHWIDKSLKLKMNFLPDCKIYVIL